jgi:SAM-dependent methyltransferase
MQNVSNRDGYENLVCPLCEGKGQSYFRMAEYFIDRCENCEFIYVRNVPSDRFLADRYRHFLRNSPERYLPERRLHKRLKNWWFAKRIKGLAKAGRRVLEIGYGHGNLLKALQIEGSLEAEGIDYSEDSLQHLETLGLNVSISSLEDKKYPDEHFAVIVGLHVLEHVQNPIQFISEVRRVLSRGGRIYFQVPCPTYWRARIAGKKWKAFGPPDHLWYFSPKAMRIFLSKHGFRVISAHCFSNRAHLTVVAEKL